MNLRSMFADLRRRLLHRGRVVADAHDNDEHIKPPTLSRDTSDTTSASAYSSTESSPTHAGLRRVVVAPAPAAAAPSVEAEQERSEQSPIDICAMDSDLVRQDDEAIGVTVSSACAHVVHTGSNFRVEWEGEAASANALTIKGKTYYAVQFHFHTPSEHTLCGKHEAMELHLVHRALDGSLAVVALFFREGKENAFLGQFWDELPALDHDHGPDCAGESHHDVTVHLRKQVDPAGLHLLEGQFYRYRGSLTTPPYTEGVEWIVLQDVAEASAQQIARYRHTIPCENAREVQPRNHRLVTLQRPCSCAA